VFNAYVSCDRSPASVKAARVSAVRVGKQGKMTQLVCGYGEGISFTWRTRAECKLEAGNCAADPAACKASCD
jgi:predicted secreted protein